GARSHLAILGPSRMDYVTGISTVQAIARYVSRYLECPPATPGHQGQRTSPSATSCSCTPARPTRPDSPVRTPHRERRLLRSARRLPRRLDRGDQEGVPEARAYPPPGREPRPGCRRAVQARLPGLRDPLPRRQAPPVRHGRRARHGRLPRRRLRRVKIDLRDVVFGTEQEVTFRTAELCERCTGSCCEPGTSPTRCTACNGSGHVQRVAQSLLGQMVTMAPCPTCGGHGDVIESPCTACSGHGRTPAERTVTVRVPSGVENGTRIQLRGEGEVGEAGGPSGDLFVELSVTDHEMFERDGDDLVLTMALPMTSAALGATIPLETFDGTRDVDVKA